MPLALSLQLLLARRRRSLRRASGCGQGISSCPQHPGLPVPWITHHVDSRAHCESIDNNIVETGRQETTTHTHVTHTCACHTDA